MELVETNSGGTAPPPQKPRIPHGRRFAKGTSGNPKGRPKVLKEVREAFTAIVDDPKYRTALYKRMLKGKVAPAVEVMAWMYAKGKPREDADPNMDVYKAMSDQELRAELLRLAGASAPRAGQKAIPEAVDAEVVEVPAEKKGESS